MDFLINNIENVKNTQMESITVEKKKTAGREQASVLKKNDEVVISNDLKKFNKELNEADKYKESLEEAKTSSQEQIKEFQEKVKKNSYNSEQVNDKIVYSLLTLPAFQRINLTPAGQNKPETKTKASVNSELEELKKIQQELSQGEQIDEVLEEALDYLMKSLIS